MRQSVWHRPFAALIAQSGDVSQLGAEVVRGEDLEACNDRGKLAALLSDNCVSFELAGHAYRAPAPWWLHELAAEAKRHTKRTALPWVELAGTFARVLSAVTLSPLLSSDAATGRGGYSGTLGLTLWLLGVYLRCRLEAV